MIHYGKNPRIWYGPFRAVRRGEKLHIVDSRGAKVEGMVFDTADEIIPILKKFGEAPECEDCGATEKLDFSPDPFSSEINGDDTDRWMCERCRRSSADDV